MDKLAKSGGWRVEYLRDGIKPKHVELNAAEPPPQYRALDVDVVALVFAAVEKETPGAATEERAALAALAYQYLTASSKTDDEALAAFFRQWRRSVRAEPKVPDFHSEAVTGKPPRRQP